MILLASSTIHPFIPLQFHPRCEDTDPAEVSFLQYTSGSTGHPKGVVIGTLNLMANIIAMKQASAG